MMPIVRLIGVLIYKRGDNMKYEYDFTIIIPCYNCSKYIKETIDSIYNQTYEFNRIEIILINDGSTDNTLDIINEYSSDNIVIIDKKNEGVSKTRNLGITKARGKYILFLDSDDYISKNTLRNIKKFFDKNYDDIDIVTYPLTYFYPTGKTKDHYRYKNCYEKGTSVYDINQYYYLVQPTINVCIKNNKKYKFDTKQLYSEDEQFNTKIIMEKEKIGFVKEAMYYYRRHKESVTSKRNTMNLEKIYKFYGNLQEKYNNHPFVQSIIMNNLNWRIREDCLIPNNMESKDIKKYISSIQKKLSSIDFQLFKNQVLDSENTWLEILSISDKKCVVKNIDNTYKLISNKEVLLDDIKTTNYINYIKVTEDKILFYGYLQTPLFYIDNIKLYATIIDKYGNKTKQEVNLFNSRYYQNKYKKEYILEIDLNRISKIHFNLIINNKRTIDVLTYPIEWCSVAKLYNNKQIVINDNIYIYNYSKLDKIKNKFKYSTNFILALQV